MKERNESDYSPQEFTGIVTGIGYDGEGVVRHEGKVVFVPYVLRGERIKYKVTKSSSSFSRGKALEIIEASEHRQVPPCPYYGRCGGCSYQHTTYQNELELKKELLANQLKKVGCQDKIFCKPSQSEYGYRNKIRLFVGKKGLSLIERGTNKLCKVDRCLLVDEEINRAISVIDHFIEKQNLYSYYDEVILRQESDQLLVNFVLKKQPSEAVRYQGLYLLLNCACGIFETYNRSIEHKVGLEYLTCMEFGLKCNFSPNSFHQVNKYVGSELYKHIVENAAGKSIINCYSGAGVLSGILAKSGKYVKGVELGISEHNDAERLKEENNLYYLSNFQGDCAKVLPSLAETGADCIIVDPPRAGMSKSVCQIINEASFKRAIYISCNSATLVRDLGLMTSYTIKNITLFDMFARTGEYETVAILEKI